MASVPLLRQTTVLFTYARMTGECKNAMMSYLSCIKKVKGVNEDECRMLAKSYLTCRMDRWVNHEIQLLRVHLSPWWRCH